jgi:RecB family endonuclease NucS
VATLDQNQWPTCVGICSIEKKPEKLRLGDSLKLVKRQFDAADVGRIDLIFEDEKGKKIVVELKLNRIGRDALNQLRRYMKYLEKQTKGEVEGVIVCKGVMPAFEEEFGNLKKIKILKYGWNLEIVPING